jgi:hypothetical protein
LKFLTGLADGVPVGMEIGYAFVKCRRNLYEADNADPIDALFIFLDEMCGDYPCVSLGGPSNAEVEYDCAISQ